MTQIRPADRNYETGNPWMERLLDRHHAEAMEQADQHDAESERRHRESMAAAARRHREILAAIFAMKEKFMATLDEVLALVSDEDTKLDSVIALVDGLKKQVDDLMAGGNIPPQIQQKIDAVFTAATRNAAKIVDALDTNVATPPPTEPPAEPPVA